MPFSIVNTIGRFRCLNNYFYIYVRRYKFWILIENNVYCHNEGFISPMWLLHSVAPCMELFVRQLKVNYDNFVCYFKVNIVNCICDFSLDLSIWSSWLVLGDLTIGT